MDRLLNLQNCPCRTLQLSQALAILSPKQLITGCFMVLRLSDCNYNNPQSLLPAGRGPRHTSSSAWRRQEIGRSNYMIVNVSQNLLLRVHIYKYSCLLLSYSVDDCMCPSICSGNVHKIKSPCEATICCHAYNLVSSFHDIKV